MRGTRGKINAIWWNIKINLQKFVDKCGYKLPANLQNFMQKDLTEVKIFQKVLGDYFFETPCSFFSNQTVWQYFDGYPANSKARRAVWKNRDFDQSHFISEMIQDGAILLWSANGKPYRSIRKVPFSMTLSDLEWRSEIFNNTKHRAVSCDNWASCPFSS